MKVILTPLEPTRSAIAAGRHPVTPELNGGVSARHSRSDKGVERILLELDQDCQRDPETQVASILEFADYGHESIRQLVPGISIHMEGVSLYLIHYIFQLMQVGAGQERRTISISLVGLLSRSTMLPASFAACVPLFIATATSAWARAGLSFVPSPVMATKRPPA